MNKRGLLAAVLLVAAGFRVAIGAELMVHYSAQTATPLAGEPVCVSGTFEFNTLAGTVSRVQWTPQGNFLDWTYSAPATGTVTEYFANGTSQTLTESATFTSMADDNNRGQLGSLMSTFDPTSMGSFIPDGVTDYTTLTEAQYLASPDPWAKILPTVKVNADEGYFFDNHFFPDNTAKLQVAPVPTPPTVWLMLCAIGCLAFFGRKLLTV